MRQTRGPVTSEALDRAAESAQDDAYRGDDCEFFLTCEGGAFVYSAGETHECVGHFPDDPGPTRPLNRAWL